LLPANANQYGRLLSNRQKNSAFHKTVTKRTGKGGKTNKAKKSKRKTKKRVSKRRKTSRR